MTTTVNIVWNPNREDVITRLAVALTQGTDWSIQKAPDPKANINYYPLYISYSQSPFNKTRVGAWMSHLEQNIPLKQSWWQTAAKGLDFRTTTAYYDELLPYGETYLVQPPIDEQFILSRPFRIGMAGYVHHGGRKGENLAFELRRNLPAHWQLVATGKGWGNIPHREYNWGELPDFYRSLDVFLCTSLIEGVPLPPLEALGLNIPLVVPYGVGMMDAIDLYEAQGVYRFQPGKIRSMILALEQAYDAVRVRSEYARQYSIARWIHDHQVAFGLHDKPVEVVPSKRTVTPVEPLDASFPYVLPSKADKTPEKASCVVYIAYGTPARDMVTKAMQSWRSNMSEPIVFIGESSIGLEDEFIQHADTDIGARSVKTQLYNLVPAKYKRILYMDADTEVLGDVSFLFKLLQDGFDFAIATNPPKYYSVGEHRRPDNGEETDETINLLGSDEMLLLNGGVFALKRSTKMKNFMNAWFTEWNRYGARDQMALIRTLYNHPVKVCYLTQSWNTIVRYVDKRITAGILHHPQSARRWTGMIDGRLDSNAAWEAVKRYEET